MTSNNLSASLNFNRVIIFRRRYQRNIYRMNQRIRRLQRRRIMNRMYQGRSSINNADVLNQIVRLPLQITNDPFANQMFNGSPFY
jgi:hypothetical protein